MTQLALRGGGMGAILHSAVVCSSLRHMVHRWLEDLGPANKGFVIEGEVHFSPVKVLRVGSLSSEAGVINHPSLSNKRAVSFNYCLLICHEVANLGVIL